MAVTVTDSGRTNGSLFGGTNSYTYTGLSGVPTAGQLLIVVCDNFNNRSISSMVLSSTGTTTSLSALSGATVTNRLGMWYCICSGSETNKNVVITLSGNAGDGEMVGHVVASGAAADQSGAVGMNESSASATSHDIGPISPPTADNLIVGASSRANRDWTENADFTVAGTPTGPYSVVYRIQSAQNDETYDFSTLDGAGDAEMILGAFAGASSATGKPYYYYAQA